MNYKVLLSSATVNTLLTQNEILNFEENFSETLEINIGENSSEMQACAYVCGFIAKNISNKCEMCIVIFVAETPEATHVFTDFKENSDQWKTLTYASKPLINCVETGATLIYTFLEKEAFKINFDKKSKLLLTKSINFDFFNSCPDHKKKIKKIICSTAYFTFVSKDFVF